MHGVDYFRCGGEGDGRSIGEKLKKKNNAHMNMHFTCIEKFNWFYGK